MCSPFCMNLLCAVMIHCIASQNLNIRFGHLGYESATVGKVLLNAAATRLHSEHILPDIITFSYYAKPLLDPFACNEYNGIGRAIDLYVNNSVDVFIGPYCNAGMPPVAQLASFLDKPVIGYMNAGPELEDKSLYRTMARPYPSQDKLSLALDAMLQHFRWHRVALIRLTKVGQCEEVNAAFVQLREKELVDIVVDVTLTDANDTNAVVEALTLIQRNARIILMCLTIGIGDPHILVTTRDVLLKAKEMGMTMPGYIYVLPNVYTTFSITYDPWLSNPYDGLDDIAKEAFLSAVYITLDGSSPEIVNAIDSLFTPLNGTIWVNAVINNISYYHALAWPVQFLADAFYLYGLALNKSFTNGTYNMSGFSGDARMNANADRLASYRLSTNNFNGSISAFGHVVPDLEIACANNTTTYVVQIMDKPNWRTIENLVPLDIPLCGFQNEYCIADTSWRIGISIFLPLAFLIFIMAVSWWYRQRLYEQQLIRNSWQLNLNLLQIYAKNKKPQAKSVFSFTSFVASGVASSTSSFSPNICITFHQFLADSKDNSYEGMGMYDTSEVFVTLMPKLQTFALRFEDWKRLDAIKRVQHDNLNHFVGAKIDINSYFAVTLWQHSCRGSLQDILFNQDITLDIMFKTSFVRDIIKGLEYLHIHVAQISYHGALRTRTCLVDGRWTIKLTDFGLAEIVYQIKRANSNNNKKADYDGEEFDSQSVFATAPELLRELDENKFTPTPQADIYSLGMVFYQIFTRRRLFDEEKLTRGTEIVMTLKKVPEELPLRPQLPKATSSKEHQMFDVIRNCWQERPVDRPNISRIRSTVNKLTKSFYTNLADHMIMMLEKYSSNLENVVSERTMQLENEVQQTDALLSQLLPRQVIDALKSGLPVPAESFESVTVFFSDIVGFTKICSTSHPMEIVIMLNAIYTEMDAVIARYDAYKVETIGDAYLVVSGLPVRNGEKHVTEIADMALEILNVVQNFVIAHQPGQQLQIRIGLHTGSVAAGVVGITMPRYCIFGSTVNIGSLMESTGEAMKIQVSQAARDCLVRIPRYYLKPREDGNDKDLGQTFWLEQLLPEANRNVEIVELL